MIQYFMRVQFAKSFFDDFDFEGQCKWRISEYLLASGEWGLPTLGSSLFESMGDQIL